MLQCVAPAIIELHASFSSASVRKGRFHRRKDSLGRLIRALQEKMGSWKKGELSSRGAAYVKAQPVQGRQIHMAGTQGTGWGGEERIGRSSKGPHQEGPCMQWA